MNTLSSISQRNQNGYILITTLVLMIMLTAMALTQISMNSSQTRVATNATDLEQSFEKTEGAMNEAINRILNSTYTTANFLQNNNGLYVFNTTDTTPLWKTIDWSSSAAVIKSFQGASGNQASYIIEQLPSVIQPGQNMKTPTYVYRITARTVGASGNTAIMLQTTMESQ